MNAITKPMLASKCERPDLLPFPVLATPKLDGIRCLKVGGKALTRSFKPISNRFAREWIEANLPDGVDGELMLRDGTFSETTSAIGRRDGQPDFVFHIFDYVFEGNLNEPYRQRVADLDGLLGFSDSDPRLRYLVFVTPTLVRNLAELEAFENQCLAAGYEGVMVRTPHSPYHFGSPVSTAIDATDGLPLTAPTFNGKQWKAERDGSITITPGRMACEFVSPILQGAAGVEHLLQFVEWANAIGAGVNPSCGCHITVGVKSIIGTDDPQAMSEYGRKLAHIARWHAMSLYGQTGTGRHLNRYSHTLGDDVGTLVRQMERNSNPARKADAASRCGRGMINFKKLFTHGVIEFRVFAGTLNRHKLMHHLATVLGLCRRAAEVECLGAFSKNKVQAKRTATAANALRFLWDYLGWTGGKRPVALGLIGPLHAEFKTYREIAERMCRRFDARFPYANL